MLNADKLQHVRREIEERAYSFIAADSIEVAPHLLQAQIDLWTSWSNLEADRYTKAEYPFRFRRYGRLLLLPNEGLAPLPHAPFYQSKENNSYAGGIAREFAPVLAPIVNNRFLAELIRFDFELLPISQKQRRQPWEIDVHQYRVTGNYNQPGYPTPEGVHRDGFDFFAVHLIGKVNVLGGVSEIYSNHRELLDSLTLDRPLDSLIVEDSRVMHAATLITPQDPNAQAYRDTLIMNFISTPREDAVGHSAHHLANSLVMS